MTINELNAYAFHDQEVTSLLFDFSKKILIMNISIFDDKTGTDTSKMLTLIDVFYFKMTAFSSVALNYLEIYTHKAFEENGVNKIYFEFLIDGGKQSISMTSYCSEFSFI